MFEQSNYILVWFLLGIIFFIVEMITPGFVLMFFGIGAWITAIVSWIGLTYSLPVQIIIFLVTSLLTLFLLRKKFSGYFHGRVSGKQPPEDSLSSVRGQKAIAATDLLPDEPGCKVEFNGTLWNAEVDEFIAKGTRVEIVERNNLVLKVKAVKHSEQGVLNS
jgi:membrane protein implicated in regulation of membrane protease activity